MTTKPPGIPSLAPRPNAPISDLQGARTAPNPYPAAPNKPNIGRFWAKNADRPEKQTQSNPIHPFVSPLASRFTNPVSRAMARPDALSSPAPNKPNLPTPEITLTPVPRYPYRHTTLRPGPKNKPKQTQMLRPVPPNAASPLTKPQQDRSIAIFPKDQRSQM